MYFLTQTVCLSSLTGVVDYCPYSVYFALTIQLECLFPKSLSFALVDIPFTVICYLGILKRHSCTLILSIIVDLEVTTKLSRLKNLYKTCGRTIALQLRDDEL